MSAVVRQIVSCWPDKPDRYRYQLEVRLSPGPALTVILKNPSLADSERLDPTVGKVEAWARRNGWGAVRYVNLFAYRSPQPTALHTLSYDAAVGPENDAALLAAIQSADVLVAAWGNPNGIEPTRYKRRIDEVRRLVQTASDLPLHIVGNCTLAGFPRHGLHWNGDVRLQVWGEGVKREE